MSYLLNTPHSLHPVLHRTVRAILRIPRCTIYPHEAIPVVMYHRLMLGIIDALNEGVEGVCVGGGSREGE